MCQLKSFPFSLRLLILICQVAGWISVASAFHNNANINFMTDNVALTCILIIRIIYLIVFVTGSVFSLIFLLLAYNDKTYGLAIPIALVDFTWTLGECTISVFSSLAESHASSYTSTNNFSYYHSNESAVNWWYTYILNQGAFAVAAFFGFLAGILNAVSGFFLISQFQNY